MQNKPYKIEACVENLDQAILAQERGADRIELCSRLDLDGLTPGRELTVKALEKLSIPIYVMIRPRAGNFNYSESEISSIRENILLFKSLSVAGIVLGVLKDNAYPNTFIINDLSALAYPLKITFHKAIDLCPDPVLAVTQICAHTKVDYILTSGAKATALEGFETIKKMADMARPGTEIIAAGNITDQNIGKVHQLIGIQNYHGRRILGDLNQ